MELKTANNLNTNFTGMETQNFSIEANAKAFRVVIDGLYTNKIKAVIRELWTNAYDSHIDAGIPSVPFDCHLPTALDPHFRVRDYGVSLTHEQVFNLYTRIFASTKDASNDMVGALGLGSKSPFSYTDSFTVIARLGGEKRTYLASIGADGTPQITLISQVESDEAQGLEVAINVKPADFFNFKREANLLAVGFDPLPSVDGLELKPFEPVYVGENGEYAIFSTSDFAPGTQSKIFIRQGCVIYPVGYEHGSGLAGFINYGHCIVLDVPIGAVSIVASREALSMDEPTIKYVQAVCATAKNKIETEILEKAALCKNRLEALNFYYGKNASHFTSIQPRFRGKPLTAVIKIEGGNDWEIPNGHITNSKSVSKLQNFPYQGRDKLLFVVRRSNQKVLRATARYRELVRTRGGRGSTNTILLTDPTTRQLERLYTLLGLEAHQIISISSLPDPGPKDRLPSATTGRTEKLLQGVNQVTSDTSWVGIAELPKPGTYYWLEVERTCASAYENYWHKQGAYMTLGMLDIPLILFTPLARKRHQPDEKFNLQRVYSRLFSENIEKLEEAYVIKQFNSTMYRFPAILKEEDESWAYAAVILLKYSQTQKVWERVREMTEAYEKKYPLLFNSLDNEAVKWYIEARDNEDRTTGKVSK